MSEAIRTSRMRWTRERTALLGFVCVVAGTAGGWAIRGMTHIRSFPPSSAATKHQAAAEKTEPAAAQLTKMAAVQAAPLLEKLKADPVSLDVLTSLGNVYYDAQQYPEAVEYYARVLRVKPNDAAVRTDMGTAFWFMGNADRALAEFQKALASVPDNPNTLFNLGMVKWKGKMDAEGAAAAWERLLATNPEYGQKEQVERMLAEVKTDAGKSPK
jgi:Tfp pilus assembly protein PilF